MSAQVTPYTPEERSDWLRMRKALFPDTDDAAHSEEMDAILAAPERNQCFIARQDGEPVGFIEMSIRDWAEGCATKNVGYVESIYVDGSHRRLGAAAALMRAGEDWARDRGAKELASDLNIDNEGGIDWHVFVGFREVARAVLFKKDLEE